MKNKNILKELGMEREFKDWKKDTMVRLSKPFFVGSNVSFKKEYVHDVDNIVSKGSRGVICGTPHLYANNVVAIKVIGQNQARKRHGLEITLRNFQLGKYLEEI